MKQIDWQMVTFVGMTLLQDVITFHHLPKIYYWDVKLQKKTRPM